jgi:hypothetical protein
MENKWFLPKKQTDEYLHLCKEAAENDKKFANFRSDPIYQMIVDNGNETGAQRLYFYIKNNYPDMLKFDDKSMLNIDDFGNPVKYSFFSHEYSNTKLRYLKIIGEILEYFPILKQRPAPNISEIGPGFGGLLLMMSKLPYFKMSKFVQYDLPEALYLQNRFFKENGHIMNYSHSVPTDPGMPIDLVISVCAYSELERGLQEEYIDKVISNAKYGYFHLNNGVEDQANYLRSKLTGKEIITRDIFVDEPINQSLFMFKPSK